MHPSTLNIDDVRARLSPGAVLDHFGVTYRVTAREFRTRRCIECGEHKRDSVAVNRSNGMWQSFACDARGDLLALVAGLSGLDVRRDFPGVLALADEISRGAPPRTLQVPTSSSAVPPADFALRWSSLSIRSSIGEGYLAARGLDARLPVVRGLLRFSERGEPAVPLRSLEDGTIVGIQRRSVDGSEPRLRVERGSRVAGAVLGSSPLDIGAKSRRVVLVEGLADTIAASLVFPDALIFGAPGASQLQRVARTLVPRVVSVGGVLLCVPDVDNAGTYAMAAAVSVAIRAGMVLDHTVKIINVRPSHDLADAVRDGVFSRRGTP